VMTLWAMMPSPLMFGGMMTKLSNDSWTLALMTNEEVLAVNQDALGNRAKRLSQQNNTEVWARDLADGRKAVALFNRGTQDATVSVTFSQLGLTGTPSVRDLWRKQDATGMTTGISVNVPHESALMYAVGTASTGTGGSGGSSGTGGSGGAAGLDAGPGRDSATGSGGATTGSGGATGTGNGGASGGAGVGGSAARGGNTGSSAGGSNGSGGSSAHGSGGAPAAAGGAVGTGGSAAMSSGGSSGSGSGGHSTNSGGSAGSVTESDAGCSCAIGAHHGSSAWWMLALGAVALLVRARRRSNR
jgi:MYXO-CTERM domain-containing protein